VLRAWVQRTGYSPVRYGPRHRGGYAGPGDAYGIGPGLGRMLHANFVGTVI